MDQEKIGVLIAKLRQAKGLTQSELGDLLGVSYKAVSKWERGINLPDTSLYKPLCDIFNITLDELLAGELKKHNSKSQKAIAIIIFLLFILCIIILFNNRQKYPNITIDEVAITKCNDHKLVNQIYPSDDNIWFYNISNVSICTRNMTCYSLSAALEYKQITMEKLKEYYHNQYILNNIDRQLLWDGGTTIYKLDDYMVIFCNTTEGNKDIYFGSLDLDDKLNGNFCGHDNSEINYFTRTYKVLNIYPSDDNEYLKITISQFQNGISLVKVPSSYNLEVDKTYEFTFYTYKLVNDTIDDIFSKCILSSVKETNKIGLAQLQEPIYVTQKKT